MIKRRTQPEQESDVSSNERLSAREFIKQVASGNPFFKPAVVTDRASDRSPIQQFKRHLTNELKLQKYRQAQQLSLQQKITQKSKKRRTQPIEDKDQPARADDKIKVSPVRKTSFEEKMEASKEKYLQSRMEQLEKKVQQEGENPDAQETVQQEQKPRVYDWSTSRKRQTTQGELLHQLKEIRGIFQRSDTGAVDERQCDTYVEKIKEAIEVVHDLDLEGTILAKQAAIQIISSGSTKNSALSHQALQLLQRIFSIESDSQALENQMQILADVVELSSEHFEKALAKVPGRLSRAHMNAVGEHINQTSLFRSTSRVSFSTFALLNLIQSTLKNFSEESIENLPDLCSFLTMHLLEKAQISEENSLFFQVFCNDLAQLVADTSIELPVALLQCKSLILSMLSSFRAGQIDLQFKLQLVDIFSLFISTFQQVIIAAKKVDSQCYCQQPFHKLEDCIQCSSCSYVAHINCVNSDSNWKCPHCNSDCLSILLQIKTFYKQYQSQYCDLSGALGFLKYRIHKMDKSQALSEEDDLVTRFNEKTWIKRGITFDVKYAKSLFRQVNCQQEIFDLYTGLRNSLVWVSNDSKLATIRAKALKGIKSIIKLEPNNLLDDMIIQVIRMRINDHSSVTRESALDLLSQVFNSKADVSAFLEIYLPMVIERNTDRCQTVRKKVIGILSQILEKHIREDVVKVLLNKWQDSSQPVRQNLSKSLTAILKKKLVSSKGISKTYNFLKSMVTSFSAQKDRKDIWEEVFSDKAARNLLIENGDELSNLCIQEVLDNEGSKVESLRLLQILAPLTPRSVEANLQIIYPMLNAEKEPTCQQLLCEILVPVIQHVYREDGGDGLPIRTAEELREAIKSLIYTCPLINIPHAIRLFEAFDQILLLQTICQCINLLGKILEAGIPVAKQRIVGRSLLIVSQGIFLLPQQSLQKVEEKLSINLKKQVSEIFDQVLPRKESPELLDLSLEALSFVWLTYPDLIEKTVKVNQKESNVFALVLQSLQMRKLHSATKGQILRTLSKFLSLQEQKQSESCDQTATLQTIQEQLQQFKDFCNHKDTLVRPAACELMTRMHEQGLITVTMAIELFFDFLVDPLPTVRQAGLINLSSLIRKRLGHFMACFNAKKVLQQTYEHQVRINPISVSAYIQHLSCDQSIVQEDKGFLESLLQQIGNEDPSLQQNFILQMINLAEDPEHFLVANQPSYCVYFGHLLLTLSRNVQIDSQAALKKVNNLLQRREQTIYARLKQVVHEGDSHSKEYSMKCFLESILIFSLKLFQKLLLKVHQKKSQVHLNWLSKAVNQLYEINLPRKNQSVKGSFCEDLLVALKAEVKAKDQHLKMKLESQLQMITYVNTGETLKRGRKTADVITSTEDQDELPGGHNKRRTLT